MKVKLLSALVFFISHITFSQTLKGKVMYGTYTIPNVEIVNSNSKSLTTSDANGTFSIAVQPNDNLIFVSKAYELKNIKITAQMLQKKEFIIPLALKAEELNEVLINNMPNIKLSRDLKWENEKLEKYTLEKNANRLKIAGVSTHTIENGMDFMKIGKLIGRWFKREKDSVSVSKKIAPDSFITVAHESCDQKFFLETLQLKPEQIELFLQFCQADPKSNTLIQNSNVLSMMDFLMEKNIAFKKQ